MLRELKHISLSHKLSIFCCYFWQCSLCWLVHSVMVLWRRSLILFLFQGQGCSNLPVNTFASVTKRGPFQCRTQDCSRPSIGYTYREHVNLPASGLLDHACVLMISEAWKKAVAENWALRLALLAVLNTAEQEVHRVCCINREHGHTHLKFYSVFHIFHKSQAMEQLSSFLANLFTQSIQGCIGLFYSWVHSSRTFHWGEEGYRHY